MAELLQDLQEMLEGLVESFVRISSRMNLDKTKVMLNKQVTPEPVVVNAVLLKLFESTFTLGKLSSLVKTTSRSQASRIQLGWAAFRKLRRVFASPIPQSL